MAEDGARLPLTRRRSTRFTRKDEAASMSEKARRLARSLADDKTSQAYLDADMADALANQANEDLGAASCYDKMGKNNDAWACRSSAKRHMKQAKTLYEKARIAAGREY